MAYDTYHLLVSGVPESPSYNKWWWSTEDDALQEPPQYLDCFHNPWTDGRKWQRQNGYMEPGKGIGPDGENSAILWTPPFKVNPAWSFFLIYDPYSAEYARKWMCVTVFVKAIHLRYVGIQCQNGVIVPMEAGFDASAGVVTYDSGNLAAMIQDFGNGWFRCSAVNRYGNQWPIPFMRIWVDDDPVTVSTLPPLCNINLDGDKSIYFFGPTVYASDDDDSPWIPPFWPPPWMPPGGGDPLLPINNLMPSPGALSAAGQPVLRQRTSPGAPDPGGDLGSRWFQGHLYRRERCQS